MKACYINIILIISVLFSLCVSFLHLMQDYNGAAQVSKINGLYIFSDSKPVSAHKELGKVSTSFFVSSTHYEKIRDNLIKRTKQKYPQAEGIILKLSNRSVDSCVAIIFINKLE